ncbi:DUF2147 domain-containing protein [Acinetobacter sp.]|uniref:DUF2147 domain-containing protein n=1 Tax=Acinetobacter sp. TaxID=472 RepID=UPI0035ADDE5C
MEKFAFVALSSVLATSAFAADLNNTQWRTVDDETGKAKALVEFSKSSNGTYTATIKKLLDPKANTAVCTECSGSQKNKPIEGLDIVQNLKLDKGNKYTGGTILDPKSGKTYKMNAEMASNGKTLKVRGFIGVAALGRNQTWHRVK